VSEAVVVAHGLWMPGVETGLLRRRLEDAGYATHLFRFRTVRASLGENVARLARFRSEIAADRLHYVGYSLGGVVVTAMLQAEPAERPGRVVCLASPLTGSRAAEILSGSNIGRRIVGRSLLELVARGGLEPWGGMPELGVIAGCRSFGAGRMVPGLPRPNDGTVAVAETELAGIQDHLVMPVTHTSILFSKPVSEQVVRFLRQGQFAR